MATSHLDADTLAAYVDGRLELVELGQVDQHIDACGECRRELSSLVAVGELPETTLGRYHVLRELGQGAMGIVFRAYDPELARSVAIKLVREVDASTRDLVRAEARALAKLRHPNVVTVYDVLVEDERMYIAMELVEGDTLRGYCKTRTARDVLAACVRAGRGLAAAHAGGVIHRDFKPDNVLCTAEGEARVSDFGLAGVAAGVAAGTPAYMAPEIKRGQPATAASDQYSFCVSAFELLAGERPIADDAAADAARSLQPAWVARVLARGLAADPAARYASMDALVDALADDPLARRRTRVLLAGGALAAIAIGALGVYVARPGPPTCEIDDSALGGAWNAARKHDVSAALTSVASEDIAGKVTAALDDYARGWVDARRDACRATAVRGEQTEAAQDRRDACLDRGRRELGELVRVLATADAKTAGVAREAVAKLRDPSECTGAEAGATPSDPISRAQLEGGRAVLDRAAALQYAGKLDEADALLSPLVTSPLPQVAGEALFVHGRIEIDRAHHEKAETALYDALSAAERAHDDNLVASIWVEIVMTTGAQQHRFDVALANARAADAALARIEPSAQLVMRYDYTLGGLLLSHGDLPAAKQRVQAGLAIAGDDPRRRAQSGLLHVSMCDIDRQQGDPASARGECENGIAQLESALGKEHMRVAIAINTQAVLAFTSHDLAGAEKLYRRVIEIFEKRGATDHLVYALAMSNLGAVYATRDDNDGARTYFERALASFDQYHPTHPQRLMPLQGLASLALRTGDTEKAVRYYEQVRDGTAKTYAADSPNLATVDFNLALAYRDAKQPDRARGQLEQMLEHVLEPGKEQWSLASRALDSLATLADDKKDFAASIQLRQRALAALAHVNDPATRALVQRQVGQTHRMMNHPALAVEPLEESLEYFTSHADDAYDLGVARYALALALWDANKDRVRAVALAKQAAVDLAKANTGDNLEHYREVMKQFLAAHGR